MKNTLVIAGLALLGAAVQSNAALNATVAANNWNASQVMYKATESATAAALPTTAWVEVLGGPVGGALTSLGAAQNPVADGYFDFGVLLIPGVTAGGQASFTVRAWSGASSYSAASVLGSVSWTQATGSWDDAAVPPAVKAGPDMQMPSFTVAPGVVPEPSGVPGRSMRVRELRPEPR